MIWRCALLILLLLAPAAAIAGSDVKTVGRAAAVNPNTLGTPPGEQSRTLLVGTDVVFKERIQTKDNGQTQILFLDQSTLTVGPNSLIVLDEFVYDPNASDGKLAISLGKGVLRFVGGVISKKAGVSIDTPTASLVIRGGISMVAYRGDITQVLVVFGQTTVQPKNGGVAQTISTSGTLASVGRKGGIQTRTASNSDIKGFNQQFQGGSGGPVTVASVDEYMGQSGLAGDVSPPSQSVGNLTASTSTDISSIQNQTQLSNSVQQVASQPGNTTPTHPSPPPPPPPPPPVVVVPPPPPVVVVPPPPPVVVVPPPPPVVVVPPPPPVVVVPPPPPPPPPVALGPFNGRFMSTPAPYTDAFGDTFNDPLGQNAVGGPIGTDQNQGVTNFAIGNGRLTATLNGGQAVDLPISEGFFPVLQQGTLPIGTPIGIGFYDPATQFFYYDLFATSGPENATVNQAVLFGGIPTPNGGLLPGGAQTSFKTWTLTPDLLSTPFPILPATFGSFDVASLFPNATITPVMAVFQDGGTIGVADPLTGAVRSHFLWAAFDIEGQGPAQTSMLVGTAGGFFSEDGSHLNLDQGVRGSIRPEASGPAYTMATELATTPDAAGNQFFGPTLNHFVLSNNETTGPLPAGYTLDAGFLQSQDHQSTTVYGYTALASETATPSGIGAQRSSQTMNGYFAAIGQSYLPSSGFLTPYAITNAHGLPTDMSMQTDTTTNTIAAVFNFANVTSADSASDVTSGTTSFGGIGYGRSAYIDDQHLGALDAVDRSLGGNINGNVGLTDQFHSTGFRSFLVSHDVVGDAWLSSQGVTPCTCQYLQWGYWDSTFNWNDPSGPNAGRNENFHIGTWVAGDLTSAAQLQSLANIGTATFTGQVVADVFDGANQYLAAGAFQDVWNFAARNGMVTVTGLDGHNYKGGVAAVPNNGIVGNGANANFAGSFWATDSSHINGRLNGSFFNAPGTPAAYQAGSLFATGPANYRLAGTFAAQR